MSAEVPWIGLLRSSVILGMSFQTLRLPRRVLVSLGFCCWIHNYKRTWARFEDQGIRDVFWCDWGVLFFQIRYSEEITL